jgi:hypothetical protein
MGTEMGRHVLYAAAVAAVIIALDIAFFKNRFWERLAVNVGIILVFLGFYFRFVRYP